MIDESVLIENVRAYFGCEKCEKDCQDCAAGILLNMISELPVFSENGFETTSNPVHIYYGLYEYLMLAEAEKKKTIKVATNFIKHMVIFFWDYLKANGVIDKEGKMLL